jgi:hypothetical protein
MNKEKDNNKLGPTKKTFFDDGTNGKKEDRYDF